MSPVMKTLLRKERRALASGLGLLLLATLGALMAFVGAVGGPLGIFGTVMACGVGAGAGGDVGLHGPMTRGLVPYELLFTQPVPRRTVLLAKLAAAGAIWLGLVALAVPGYLIGLPGLVAPQPRPAPAILAQLAVGAFGLAWGLGFGMRLSYAPPRSAGEIGRRLGLMAGIVLPVALGFVSVMNLEVPPERRLQIEATGDLSTIDDTIEKAKEAIAHIDAYQKATAANRPEVEAKAEAEAAEARVRTEYEAAHAPDVEARRAWRIALAIAALGLAGAALSVRSSLRAIEAREVGET